MTLLNNIDLKIIEKIILLDVMVFHSGKVGVQGAYFSTMENLVPLFLEFSETLVSLPV